MTGFSGIGVADRVGDGRGDAASVEGRVVEVMRRRGLD